MANTTNFNWETPDDTDLVKDGAAAIRTLGSAIDTSLVDLKGGTTDQVLAKNSNTDMDFKWVTSDDANAIQNAIVDAKGDIIAASANDTPARLAVGTNNHRLVAASGETTGLKYVADTQNTVVDAEGDLLVGDAADTLQRLAVGTTGQVLTVDTTVDGKIKWATAAGGASGLTKITSATFTAVSSVSFPDNTFTSTYKDYLVQFNVTTVSANTNFQGRMRASGSDNTVTEYFDATQVLTHSGTESNRVNNNQTKFNIGYVNSGTDQFSRAYNFISPQIAKKTRIWGGGLGVTTDYTTNTEIDTQLLHHNTATSFDSFTFIASGGTMTGYYAVYGLEA